MVSQRYLAKIEYLGTNYHGWQSQAHSEPTIQTTLQNALSQLANHPITVVCSGRTDKGVHAKGQIVHFDSTAKRSIENWIQGTNHLLPDDISVQSVHLVNNQFHARFSAYERCYEYHILNQPTPSALLHKRAYHLPYSLHKKAMQMAADYLIGTHDFSTFRASGCQAKSPIKTIKSIEIKQTQALIQLNFCADSYLYHMIRNISACLIAVGRKKHPPSWVHSILENKNRQLAPAMLPPHGLYLSSIHYPDECLNKESIQLNETITL